MSDWYLHRGEAYAFIRSLPNASVQALITDPPYSSGGQFRADRARGTGAKYQRGDTATVFPDFTGDNRDQRSFLAWCTLWLSESFRVLADGAPVVLFSDWRQLPLMTDALQASGFIWRGIVPWCKPHARPAKGRFSSSAEFAVWGSKGPLPEDGPCHRGFFVEKSVHHTRRLHQTEKPLRLMRHVVRIAPPGGVILDPFVGSGATGVAALAEGRSFVGCELSEEYYQRATGRLARAA